MGTKSYSDEEIAALKKTACSVIDAAADELNTLSQDIWKHPELAYKEHHAHKVLTDYLAGKGFNVQRAYHVDTAFRAEPAKSDAAGPNIAVLCEYDALPEVDHGCGHNLIAEVGIAAGLGIKAALDQMGYDKGHLTVLGTPAEEEGGGKVDLIRAGAFNDIDVAMMSHPGRSSISTAAALAMTEVYVTYHGKASHASGFPWEGVNALDAAVLAYTNLSVMRQQIKPTWRVHGVFTDGGAKPNIIPERAALHYYLRTPTAAELQKLMKMATGCFEGAATATGCTVSFKWDDKPYENVITNNTIRSLYEDNAIKEGTDFSSHTGSTGSTDMGNVTHVVPGIHPHFAIGTPFSAHTKEFCKRAGSVEAQTPTLREGKILAMTSIDILCRPQLLDTIKKEFKENIKAEQEQ